MKIQEIAKICGYEFCGADRDIRMISYADTASEESLAIVHTQKEVFCTRAGAVLTEPGFIRTDKTILIISEPLDVAAVKVAMLLVQNKEIKLYEKPDYNTVNGYFAASNVVIGNGTVISPNVYIDEDVRIGNHCIIEPNVYIKGGSLIGDDVRISSGSVIGENAFCHYYDAGLKSFSGIGKVIIGNHVEIGCNSIIQRGTFSDTVVGEESKIGNLVDIGHDVRIGSHCKIVSQTGIAGRVSIGDWVTVYGQTGIANHVIIGDHAVVMAQSLVTKNVKAGEKVSGRFARKHSDELRREAKINRLCEVR